jgi:16S rRNA (cytidine1402-2'-O)-methyltransferase
VRLLVVATPLGNHDDLSPRALHALRSVDLILCEDTRRTARLLAAYDIRVETVSCYRGNELARVEPVLDRLRQGEQAALVSDAGTPGVSDPGAQLVRAVVLAGFEVSPLPGPSAITALLSVSGLPADSFVFDGFLPHRGGERRRRLRELARERRTVVVFETPHRIHATLRDVTDVLGEREIVLGRELTKLHETVLRGSASEVAARLGEPVRGEIVLALAPADGDVAGAGDERILRTWRAALAGASGDRRAALRRAARELGIARAELHRRLVELREADSGERRLTSRRPAILRPEERLGEEEGR